MSQFDEAVGPTDELVLNDSPELSDVGQAPPPMPAMPVQAPAVAPAATPLTPADVGILPDLRAVLGPVPRLPVPSLPQLPPPTMSDPRAKLAALGAMLSALVVGHTNPGAATGIVQGTLTAAQMRDRRNLQVFQQQQAEAQRQQALIGEQQRAVETAYDRKERDLKTSLLSLNTALQKAPNKAVADQVYEAFGASLQAAGYPGMDANYLRQTFRYIAPGRDVVASKAFDQWLSNPQNKSLLEQNPRQALVSTVPVDLNGDGKAEPITIADLADVAHRGFARDPTTGQSLVVPKPVAGSSEFVTALNARLQKFRAENSGQDPNPSQYQQLVTDATDAAKGGGASEFDRYVSTREKEIGRKLSGRELVTARRQYFGETDSGIASTKQQAAQALYAAVLHGGDIPRSVAQQVERAGLDVSTEIANARKRLIDVGRSLMTEMDRATAQDTGYDPEALIARARKALIPGATPPPPMTLTPRSPQVRAEARRQLETARTAAGDARPVTEGDLDQALAKPGNVEKIRQRLAARPQP